MFEALSAKRVSSLMLLTAILLSGCGEAVPEPSAPETAPPPQAKSPNKKSSAETAKNAKKKSPRLTPQPAEADEQAAGDSPPSDVAAAPSRRATFRPPDTRPDHDRAQIAKHGIHAYESKRLLLYTDLDPEVARGLPPLIDQAYEAWEAYFGFLPDNAARADFQITGYIMVNRQRFADSGLLPADLPESMHGRQIGAEFWMNDQQQDYYRRHLMIHEATHCFMNAVPHAAEPLWYMEGMAELFATHQIAPDGKVIFGVMPRNLPDFSGWGRIRMIKEDLAAGKPQRLAGLMQMPPETTLHNSDYAWFWALCKFLDTHPRYRERFRELGKSLYEDQFEKTLAALLAEGGDGLREEWQLFASHLIPGYDIERCAIDFHPGIPLEAGMPASAEISADRGWQSSRIQVWEGTRYVVTASGRYALAQTPKPWESEPQGISYRYFNGKPLGLLLAAIRTEPPAGPNNTTTLLNVFPVGRHWEFVAPHTGTLYFRINDLWSELEDNTGAADVEIRESEEASAP